MGETMQHVFAPLRKLQWQLSLSYIMVVMVAIPALLGVGLALLVILTPPATRLSPAEQLVQGVESQIAPQILQGMQGHPNQIWLEQWAINFIENQRTKANTVEQQAVHLNVAEKLAVMILDPGGKVIASDPAIPPSVMHPGLSTQQFLLQKLQLDTPESQNVIRAAFANDQRSCTCGGRPARPGRCPLCRCQRSQRRRYPIRALESRRCIFLSNRQWGAA